MASVVCRFGVNVPVSNTRMRNRGREWMRSDVGLMEWE